MQDPLIGAKMCDLWNGVREGCMRDGRCTNRGVTVLQNSLLQKQEHVLCYIADIYGPQVIVLGCAQGGT